MMYRETLNLYRAKLKKYANPPRVIKAILLDEAVREVKAGIWLEMRRFRGL